MQVRLSPAARLALERLIDRWELHAELELALPVPIERVARNEGWTILWGRIFPFDGYAIVPKHGGRRIMRIDERLTDPWQRVTIAHEMGHQLAGHRGAFHSCHRDLLAGARSVPAEEAEATKIGMRLLVPDQFLRDRLSAAEIARRCDVPRLMADWLIRAARR